MKWLAMLSASVLCGATYASATQWPVENTPLRGYQCYTVNEQALDLTQDDYFSGRKFPVILANPQAGSKPVGRVAAIFYVTWPLKVENGFAQVLYHTDRLGWIPRSDIRALRKADGSSGGCNLWWGKDGRIMFALDPGVGIRN